MKNVKRIISFAIIFMIGLTAFPPFKAEASFKPSFEIASDAAYMVNTDTDTVVYEKNPDKKIYPASLTKIMSTLLAIEHVKDLEGTVVTAPNYIFDELYLTGASTADIRHGEEVRMIDLLYANMLPSACEASSIIADYIGEGSIPAFVDMMNAKAKELGAVNTHFVNAHGLHEPDQVTTARDMYLITKYAMDIPLFVKICNTPNYVMPVTNKHDKERNVTHTNNMLSVVRGGKYYYKDMIGIKTGSLPQVGKNLASSVSSGGYNYTLITLGGPAVDKEGKPLPSGTNTSYADAVLLYDWALSNFANQKVLKINETIDEVPVKLSSQQDYVTLVASKDINALLPGDVGPTAVGRTIIAPDSVTAPIEKGTVLGRLELKLSDDIIATVDLVAKEDIKRNEILYTLDIVKRFFAKPSVIVLLVILFLLIFIYAIMSMRYKNIKRKRELRARNNLR